MSEYKFDRNTKMQYSNSNAEVIIVGITPGNTQLINNRENKSPEEIKRENAFAGGNMRRNLIDMLDYVGINKVLQIPSCESIFENDFNKVELTSLLKDATFEVKNDKEIMFNKPLKILSDKMLQKEFESGFINDCKKYKKAKLIVALGKENQELLIIQKKEGKINSNIEIIGIPHPSGANAGRVNAFLGKGKESKDSSYEWAKNAANEAREIIQRITMKK